MSNLLHGSRLLEVDYSGIEAVQSGYYQGDPNYIRLASLGVHAYLASFLVGKPANLTWSDVDLVAYFSAIKHSYPIDYDKAKRCVHGNNYGLTVFGMVENFPEVYPTIKAAQAVQDLYYSVAPKLPGWHRFLRDKAYENGRLGGAPAPGFDYGATVSTGLHHPYAYRHWFWGVLTYKPITPAQLRFMQKLKRANWVILHGRPFKIEYGEDSKRVIAFFPQSTAAGNLKEAELRLFMPDSPSYIGDAWFGRTPLRAPIHDSLLLEIPNRIFDRVAGVVLEEMQRPIYEQPIPAEWGFGSHLKIGVAAKTGVNWMDMEELTVPGTTLGPIEPMYSLIDAEELEEIEDLETRMTVQPAQAA